MRIPNANISRNTPKCGEPEIRNWINGKSGKIAFEEKLTIFLFRA